MSPATSVVSFLYLLATAIFKTHANWFPSFRTCYFNTLFAPQTQPQWSSWLPLHNIKVQRLYLHPIMLFMISSLLKTKTCIKEKKSIAVSLPHTSKLCSKRFWTFIIILFFFAFSYKKLPEHFFKRAKTETISTTSAPCGEGRPPKPAVSQESTVSGAKCHTAAKTH